MRNAQDLQEMVTELEAIPTEKVQAPDIPVSTYLQEAEDLNAWMQPDRALLVAHGQPEARLDNLPVRIGALRQAESEWNAARHGKEAVQAECDDRASEATKRLGQSIRHFRYAFRGRPDLLGRLPDAGEWMSRADRIQGLNDLAVLGAEHADLLRAAGYDPANLEELAAASDALAGVQAAARNERASGRGTKVMRDRAYTHLKAAVDEIRAAARFLFWDNEARLRGYRSDYARRRRSVLSGVSPLASPTSGDESSGTASTIPQ